MISKFGIENINELVDKEVNERRIEIWLVTHDVETNNISWFDIALTLKEEINGWKTWLAIVKMEAIDVNGFYNINIVQWKKYNYCKELD